MRWDLSSPGFRQSSKPGTGYCRGLFSNAKSEAAPRRRSPGRVRDSEVTGLSRSNPSRARSKGGFRKQSRYAIEFEDFRVIEGAHFRLVHDKSMNTERGIATVSETSTILQDTASRLFNDLYGPSKLASAASGAWLGDEWQELEEMGFPWALVPEEAGGFGVETADALRLLRLAGSNAVPAPLAETMLGHWLFAVAGLPAVTGPITIALTGSDEQLAMTRNSAEWRLAGRVNRVPWGRWADTVLALAHHDGRNYLCQLGRKDFEITADCNVAGEPRDTLAVDTTLDQTAVVPTPADMGPDQLLAFGATARCLSMAGAMERVLDMSVTYSTERRQFGRPIGKFQAVQQNLAFLAGEVAAAGAAADLAAQAFTVAPNLFAVGAAKLRCSEAAGVVSSIGHQVHGAIGFTEEHSLHFYTKRLLAWRDEFGRDLVWSRIMGRRVLAAGGAGLWQLISSV